LKCNALFHFISLISKPKQQPKSKPLIADKVWLNRVNIHFWHVVKRLCLLINVNKILSYTLI